MRCEFITANQELFRTKILIIQFGFINKFHKIKVKTFDKIY